MASFSNIEDCKALFKNGKIEQTLDAKNSDEFTNNLTVLTEQLPLILEEFKKSFVLFNKKPEYADYQNMFANAKNNLVKIGSEAFSISNNVQFVTNELNQKLICLNAGIMKEKEMNRQLKKKLGILENKNNASSELIHDYKEMYNETYLRNWGLFLSIIVVFIVIKNMYTNINGDIKPSVKNMTNNVYKNAKNMGNDIYKNAKNLKGNVNYY
jgi:hypothetical protein